MNIELRDYQIEAVKSVIDEAEAGINRQLISLPTGSGKTIVMAAIAKHFNKKTLLLAHREELIIQAAEKFKLFWPEASIGVCMAGRDEIDNQIVVGSIQSCSRPKRLERLKEQGFELLMVDEAHHSKAESYQSVIKVLDFSHNTNRLLIGVTATPDRSDKQPLGDTFDKISFSRSISTMIRAGYLSPVTGRKILTSFVLERIHTHTGDFATNELSEAVNTPERNAFIVEKFKAYASTRKGIAFCCDVQHCNDLAEAFTKQEIAATSVWGDMKPESRKQALDDIKTGRIQIVTSCGILTEGYDEPSVNVILMCRPTKSVSLYIQCVGRGLRLWPGKQNCLVLDFSDKGHSLDSIMSLDSAIPEAVIFKEEPGETDREEIDKQPKIKVIEECDREFDILGATRFIWISIGGNEWSLIDDERREIIMQPAEDGYVATLYFPDGSSRKIVESPLPLGYCSGICEDFARRNLKIEFADVGAIWMNQPVSATKGQKEFLEKKGVLHSNMTKAQAALEIRKIIALKNKQWRLMSHEPITSKQKFFLTARGVDTGNMSKLQAMQAISEIKKHDRILSA